MKRFSSALLSILILLSILGGCKKQEVPDQVNLPEQEQTNTPVAQTEPETETEQNWQTSEPEHLSIEIKLPEASVRHAQSYQEVFQLFSAARDDTDENNRYLPETVDPAGSAARRAQTSRSTGLPRAAISSPRFTLSSASSPTALSRRRIATADRSGRSTQARSMRPPMGVRVLSSTHSREPFFSPLRRDSVSSRLRRVVQSSSMKRPP